MPDLKRHIGKLKNTDRKCVVVFMQLPGDEQNALVVDTDALPERFHEELMNIVEGEGQRHTNLADLIGRRMSQWNSSFTIMQALHNSGYLQKQPIENVLMIPMPGKGVELTEIIRQEGSPKTQTDPSRQQNLNTQPKDFTQNLNETTQMQDYPDPNVGHATNSDGYNRIAENQAATKEEDKLQQAQNMLVEAQMLEGDAQKKREQAYKIAPNLRPQQENKSSGQKKTSNQKKSSTKKDEQAANG